MGVPDFLLREHDTNSKKNHLILPIFLEKIAHGKLKLTIDRERLWGYLMVKEDCITWLTNGFFYNDSKIKKFIRKKIDYEVLANEYDQLLKNGEVKNRAELARKFNVSRTLITKVFKSSNQMKSQG